MTCPNDNWSIQLKYVGKMFSKLKLVTENLPLYRMTCFVHLHGYASDSGRLQVEVKLCERDTLLQEKFGREAIDNRRYL